MADEMDELKKLSPEQRLRKLKELEEKRKKEIAEAQEMMQMTEAEIEEEAKEKERIPVPQLKSDSLASLQTEEEKQLFATKRYVRRKSSESPAKKEKKVEDEPVSLEDTVFSEEIKLTPQELDERRAYQHQLAKDMSASDMYNKIADINKQAQEAGYLSAAQQREKNDLLYAAQYKSNDIASGAYKEPPKEAEKQLSSIFSKYKQ